MSELYRHAPVQPSIRSAVAASLTAVDAKFRDTEPYVLFWWTLTACVAASQIGEYFGDSLGPLQYVLTVAGAAGCAWMWILSRALFRPAKRPEPWPLLMVGAVIVIESYWHFTSALPASGLSGEFRRVGENSASLVCMGAIAMVFVEVFSGLNPCMPRIERRFRQIFASAFGTVIIVALVWANNASEMTMAPEWRQATLVGCALFMIVASRLAVNFRKRNPLPVGAPKNYAKSWSRNTADDSALAQRIVTFIDEKELYTTPNLKVSHLAEALGEQDYKVTQCITGRLKYRNFNQFINFHRIERAKCVLTDTQHQGDPILSVAFDCGFNSIGPFNRAFKQHVGMTPREFRAAHSEQVEIAEKA